MTASMYSQAAPAPAGGQLAPGAILTRARCLSFEIAGGKPNPAGNGVAATRTSSPKWSRRLQLPRSSKHQPTQNIRGCRSERNPIPVRVRNDADLSAGRADQLSLESPALRFFTSMVARVNSLVGHRYQPSSVISQTLDSCVQSPVLQSEIGTGDRDNASHGE